MAQIICSNLSLGYDSKVILSGLSFEVNSGDYLCVIGENGSGKSTLMKTLLGLQTPLGGKIVLGDGLVSTQIGYLPQQTEVQKDFPASVEEIVLSGIRHRRFHPFHTKADRILAEKNMERMDILSLQKECFRELSGGQKQRVLLARALCATKKLLLLDEPVSGLDPKITRELYGVIEDINRTDGITVIMVTHDITGSVEHASHILYMGRTVFFGTKEEYADRDDAECECFCHVKGGHRHD